MADLPWLPTVALAALGLGPPALTVYLLVRYRFEALIGARYLTRAAPPGRRPRIALAIAAALVAVGLALLFGARGRGLPVAAGAVMLLIGGFGGLGALTLLRFSVFTTVSAIGLSLGVAALVVVLAVTGGFQRDYLARVIAFHGHLVVGLYGEPSLDEARAEIAALDKKLADLPGLVSTGPFAVSFSEVSIGPGAAALKGLDPKLPNALREWMVAGDLAHLGRPASCGGAGAAPGTAAEALAPTADDEFIGRIVLGRPLAKRVRANVGDCVRVVIPFGRPGQLQPESLLFEVVGIFEMGFHQHDTRLAYVAMDDLRRIETARPFIYGLELLFADPLAVAHMMPEIERRVGSGYRVLDWRLLSQGLFSALQTQRVLIGLFLSIIILVSAFNLVASLYIIVLTKAREIAILGALGARPRTLLRIFVMAGGMAGLLGTGVGLFAGIAMCALVAAYDFKLDAAVYMIAELPIDLALADVAVLGGAAQLVCLLATVPPVLRARRLKVVEGLRQV